MTKRRQIVTKNEEETNILRLSLARKGKRLLIVVMSVEEASKLAKEVPDGVDVVRTGTALTGRSYDSMILSGSTDQKYVQEVLRTRLNPWGHLTYL